MKKGLFLAVSFYSISGKKILLFVVLLLKSPVLQSGKQEFYPVSSYKIHTPDKSRDFRFYIKWANKKRTILPQPAIQLWENSS